MDAFDRERNRPHGALGVGSLASLPLEANLGISRVEVFGAELEGAAILVHRPTLASGERVRQRSLVLPHRPALAPIASPDSSALFESDGATVRAQLSFAQGTSFYGAGLAAASLLTNGTSRVFWNTDAWRYGAESPSLYSSHPAALALDAEGAATIVVADSHRRGAVQFAADGIEFAFEREPFDLWTIRGALDSVFAAFSAIIGRMRLPPLWTLGYHQCRWSYASQAEVLALAREFRERALYCDAIWLDIDHMDRLRALTFDTSAFPDPRAMLDELHAQHFRCVAIVDPGLSIAADCELGERALAEGHCVLDASGKFPVLGRVWPGVCRFPDFSREATRRWWGAEAARFAAVGLDGLWCDMNEPSVFRTPTKTLDRAARHRGSGGGTHDEFHNLYGHWMARATREGLERARPTERAFVLTRSSHLATARYSASWTGDNQAAWQDLRWAIPMVLALGLSGQPFAGPDLGGFDGDPSEELFVRWFELGAFLPFARGHSEKSARRKEPWSFGPRAETLIREALARRARLLPTLYTAFVEAHERGLPVARPMFFADPRDARLRALDDQFMLGGELLVAPILEAGCSARRVVLPRGGWYPCELGGAGASQSRLDASEIEVDAPLGRTPLFARSGSILALGPRANSTEAVRLGERELHVFPDEHGRARGVLVEDDGRTHARGRRSEISVQCTEERAEFEVVHRGRYVPPPRRWTAIVHGSRGARAIDVASQFARR